MCFACHQALVTTAPLDAGPGAPLDRSVERRRFLTGGVATAAVLSAGPLLLSQTVAAASGTRSLYLRNLYTEEVRRFRYIVRGRPDWDVFYRLHAFMGDVRNHDMIEIDPRLLDQLWAIQQRLGSAKPLGLVSVFRSWQTNSDLRNRGRGVARLSYHLQGRAADIAVEGVSAVRLGALARQLRGGGVGTYSRSAFPFVHVDTGPVRRWGQ